MAGGETGALLSLFISSATEFVPALLIAAHKSLCKNTAPFQTDTVWDTEKTREIVMFLRSVFLSLVCLLQKKWKDTYICICIWSCNLYLSFTKFFNGSQKWSPSLQAHQHSAPSTDTQIPEGLPSGNTTPPSLTAATGKTESNSLEAEHAVCVTPICHPQEGLSTVNLSLNVLLFFLVLVLDQLNTKALWVLFILKSLFAGWWHHYSTSRLDQNY